MLLKIIIRHKNDLCASSYQGCGYELITETHIKELEGDSDNLLENIKM